MYYPTSAGEAKHDSTVYLHFIHIFFSSFQLC
jgi:hypothetical protein